MIWLAFYAGCVVGVVAGFFLAAALAVAKRSDERDRT